MSLEDNIKTIVKEIIDSIEVKGPLIDIPITKNEFIETMVHTIFYIRFNEKRREKEMEKRSIKRLTIIANTSIFVVFSMFLINRLLL